MAELASSSFSDSSLSSVPPDGNTARNDQGHFTRPFRLAAVRYAVKCGKSLRAETEQTCRGLFVESPQKCWPPRCASIYNSPNGVRPHISPLTGLIARDKAEDPFQGNSAKAIPASPSCNTGVPVAASQIKIAPWAKHLSKTE